MTERTRVRVVADRWAVGETLARLVDAPVFMGYDEAASAPVHDGSSVLDVNPSVMHYVARIASLTAGSTIAVVEGLDESDAMTLTRASIGSVVELERARELMAVAVTANASDHIVVPRWLWDSTIGTLAKPAISEEEMGWLALLGEGVTVIELSVSSGYSERSMYRRLARLYERLGVVNRHEALQRVARKPGNSLQ